MKSGIWLFTIASNGDSVKPQFKLGVEQQLYHI